MALASYGKPVYAGLFRDIIHVHSDGRYAIDAIDFTEHFGPRRKKGDAFGALHFNIAHSLQVVLQETVLKLTEWL